MRAIQFARVNFPRTLQHQFIMIAVQHRRDAQAAARGRSFEAQGQHVERFFLQDALGDFEAAPRLGRK